MGGREEEDGGRGKVDDEMPGRATAHCIPICMQMVWCERRAYITRSELRLRHNRHRAGERPSEAVSHQDSHTHPHRRKMNDDFMHARRTRAHLQHAELVSR